jgi:hypothetical protein
MEGLNRERGGEKREKKEMEKRITIEERGKVNDERKKGERDIFEEIGSYRERR